MIKDLAKEAVKNLDSTRGPVKMPYSPNDVIKAVEDRMEMGAKQINFDEFTVLFYGK